MAQPLVTIGVCVRNCESTLKQAIQSVIDQDYPHEFMEVIFVDDGSEDRTLSVIQHYVERMDMLTEVYSDEWKGLGPARNVVVDNATGDYILWVDGDMILPEDHVRKQVEFMEKNRRVGIAKGRYGNLSGGGLVGFLENAAFQAVDSKFPGKVTSRVLGTGGSIYRAEAIRQVGGFDNEMTGVGEDADAEHRVKNGGWLLYRATPAVFYERRRETWKALWNENFWHGCGAYDLYQKSSDTVDLLKMSPLGGFVAGVWYSIIAYKSIFKKRVFLLPIEYTFKRTAWFFGFVSSQTKS